MLWRHAGWMMFEFIDEHGRATRRRRSQPGHADDAIIELEMCIRHTCCLEEIYILLDDIIVLA